MIKPRYPVGTFVETVKIKKRRRGLVIGVMSGMISNTLVYVVEREDGSVRYYIDKQLRWVEPNEAHAKMIVANIKAALAKKPGVLMSFVEGDITPKLPMKRRKVK